MSHHLIDISEASCSITCRQGQLICKPKDGPERRAPMEDIGAVLVNSFSASIHNRVFLEAAAQGAMIVFCENFRPSALLLPANRSTDTLLTRGQIGLPEKLRETLWRKTVTAKCMNQAAYARLLAPESGAARCLAEAAATERSDKESRCARMYWKILAGHLDLEDFKRRRDGGGLNDLLNYGYTVLLARMLQKMIAVGLDPTFGIGHAVRERATPLAYDLMEPFRVAVDARIADWIQQMRTVNEETPALEVSREYKQWVQGFLKLRAPYRKKEISVEHLIEHVLQGFREAVCRKQQGHYRPWKLGNTKWAGFS
jgi:CRISP-associated protein Cas1